MTVALTASHPDIGFEASPASDAEAQRPCPLRFRWLKRRPLPCLVAAVGPVVYSVGRNGVDNTPDAKGLPSAPWSGWHGGREEYRDLERWVPPPTTTRPAAGPSTAPEDGGSR